DPKSSDFACYRGATLITPNLSEFKAAAGNFTDEAELVAKGQALMKKYQLEGLLVTRSEQGMTLLQPEQAEIHIPTQAQDVFDVTGAGDTVIATFALALAAGANWQQAMRYANAAAGIVVSKLGAATVSLPELRRALQPELVR